MTDTAEKDVRYTCIDGMTIEVVCCAKCPYYSTEMECAGYCQYPENPASSGAGFCYMSALDGIRSDCPLKVKSQEE